MLGGLLIGYALALAIVAAAIRRRTSAQEARTFYVADGRLSAPITAASLVATSVGGSSTVVTAALIYRHGLAGIWIDLAGTLGLLLLAAGVARRVRQTGVASIAELAGLFYGPIVRRATALIVVVAEIAWLALLAKATAALLAPALPQLAAWQLAALMLLAVLFYTALGGQYAVAYSDLLQLALMVIGLLVVAPLYVQRALVSQAAPMLPMTLSFPTSATLGWRDAGSFVLLMGLPHLVGSDIYAKLLSARDGRSAARGALGAALLKLLFALGVAFLAMGAARLLPLGTDADAALGTLIHRVLPLLVAPWVLLALVATTMSSADQVLLSAITMTLHDLLPKVAGRRGAKELVGLLFALAAFALAVALPTVVDAMKVGYTLFACGVTLPLLMALLGLRPALRGMAAAAMVGGALVGGGLHVARLLDRFAGEPVIWGLVFSALLLLLGRPRRGVEVGCRDDVEKTTSSR